MRYQAIVCWLFFLLNWQYNTMHAFLGYRGSSPKTQRGCSWHITVYPTTTFARESDLKLTLYSSSNAHSLHAEIYTTSTFGFWHMLESPYYFIPYISTCKQTAHSNQSKASFYQLLHVTDQQPAPYDTREMVSVSCWLKLVWPWRSPCGPAAISAGCQILRPLPGCWACPFPAPRLVWPCADSFQTSNHKNNSIPSLHVDHTNDSVQGQKSRAGAERNAGTCGWGHGTTLQLLVHRLKFTDLFNLREVRMKKQRLKCNRLEQVFRCCP